MATGFLLTLGKGDFVELIELLMTALTGLFLFLIMFLGFCLFMAIYIANKF